MSGTRLGLTGRQLLLRGSHAAAVAGFVGLVGVLTMAGASKPEVARALAASPARLARGHVWLLVSSGLLAERPVGVSVVSFVLLAVLTLGVCERRTFWWAAAFGHVGSTVVVYGVIGLARLSEPRAFSSVFWSHDYGVSAISAAWLGAIATVGWRVRGKNAVGRLAIALGCLAVGLFAYTAHPGLTIIASEHVLAFGFGIAVASALVDPVRARARLWQLVRRAQPI